MRIKVKLHGGPRDGQDLTFPAGRPIPDSIWLPVWPEPDETGPPYPQARYHRASQFNPVRYVWDRTEYPTVKEGDGTNAREIITPRDMSDSSS